MLIGYVSKTFLDVTWCVLSLLLIEFILIIRLCRVKSKILQKFVSVFTIYGKIGYTELIKILKKIYSCRRHIFLQYQYMHSYISIIHDEIWFF